jgi:NTE family protein
MKRLIIGPGSMIFYSFIGSIKYLKESGHLDDLEEISCSSAGAIIGMFYVLTKGDVDKMLEMSLDVPLTEIAKPDIKCLLTKFGFIDAGRFEKRIAKDAKKVTGIDPTFKELYEWNPIKLYIPTYDLVTSRTIYMSVENTPDMKVSHAVRRSISIPIIMTPVDYRYLDGSVTEFSPHVPFLGKTDVLEIRFRSSPKPKHKPTSLLKYLYEIVMMFLSTRVEYTSFPRLDIYVDDSVNIFNFSMSVDEKLNLYRIGYYQACEHLPYCCRSDRESSSTDSRNPVCSRECTRDQEVQSQDQHHREACDSDGSSGRPESPLSDSPETDQ